MRRLQGNKGFTLIELIVVIVILAVLAMIAVPSVTSYIKTSRINTVNANLQSVAATMTRMYTEEGSIAVPDATDVPTGFTVTTTTTQPKYNIVVDLTKYNLIGTYNTTANFPSIKGVAQTAAGVGTTTITYSNIDASK